MKISTSSFTYCFLSSLSLVMISFCQNSLLTLISRQIKREIQGTAPKTVPGLNRKAEEVKLLDERLQVCLSEAVPLFEFYHKLCFLFFFINTLKANICSTLFQHELYHLSPKLSYKNAFPYFHGIDYQFCSSVVNTALHITFTLKTHYLSPFFILLYMKNVL